MGNAQEFHQPRGARLDIKSRWYIQKTGRPLAYNIAGGNEDLDSSLA